MYLHIGQNVSVLSKNIISVIDIEGTTVSGITRDFLKISEEEGFIITICDKLPKSVVICEEDKRSRIYLSPISPMTLKKRIELRRNDV